ncbi:DUF1611 domain-containing protein [Agrococcus sp. ARC_14]|uniref:DUF1611 domain-containing protein n=1 Tax=Agrococcus sp. ARC_14 TaxID=2919927 RepID=UPI001F068A9E|nr:DUF1611 domain-containing protein [Agrococcus sp. ARC_14]MCH1883792.1 DUF1611 domain-containing protein [Agrococcus sp. ARC_14]
MTLTTATGQHQATADIRTAVALAPGAMQGVKRAYSTRRVDLDRAAMARTDIAPANGDLVLATVGTIGQHARIELPTGRRAPMREGERVVVAFSNRYAPDQFEAVVPDDLGPTSLVAGGGIAGRVIAQHARMEDATELLPIGLLADADGRVLNVADGAIGEAAVLPRPPVVAVVGAAMNSGKTTTVAKLVQGLATAGERVGAIKVTGTGSGGDVWSFRDHGAHVGYDFTDFGWATTAGIGVAAVAEILRRGIARLTADGCTAIVVEVADGVFQRETGELVEHPAFAEHVDAVLFAATDALCGVAGIDWLERRGHAPLAVSGVLTASPLAIRELAGQTSTPIWDIDTLADAGHAKGVLVTARELRDR